MKEKHIEIKNKLRPNYNIYVPLRIFRNFFSHNKKSQNLISIKDKYFLALSKRSS